MAKERFRYPFQTAQVPGVPPLSSARISVWRPVVKIQILGPVRSIHVRALLDTGSDLPMFDADLLSVLGFPLSALVPGTVAGIGGRADVKFVKLGYRSKGSSEGMISS